MVMEAAKKTDLKTLALNFLHQVIRGEIQTAFDTSIAPGFIHHNAFTPAGAAALQKGMQDNHEHFPEKIFTVKTALAEGTMVAVHSLLQFTPEHKGLAVVHLFRFEGDKIAELWDVVQILPEDSPNPGGPL